MIPAIKVTTKAYIMVLVPLMVQLLIIVLLNNTLTPMNKLLVQEAVSFGQSATLRSLIWDADVLNMLCINSAQISQSQNRLSQAEKEQIRQAAQEADNYNSARRQQSAAFVLKAPLFPEHLRNQEEFKWRSKQLLQHMQDLQGSITNTPEARFWIPIIAEKANIFVNQLLLSQKFLQHKEYKKSFQASTEAIFAISEIREKLGNLYQLDLQQAEKRWLNGSSVISEIERLKVQELWTILTGLIILTSTTLGLSIWFKRSVIPRLQIIMSNMLKLGQEEDLAQPLPGKDELALIDSSFHDLAGIIKAARQRERAIILNTTDVICALDRTGKFTSVNPAAERIWGYKPEQLIHTPLSAIIAEPSLDQIEQSLKNLQNTHAAATFKTAVVHFNGSYKEMLWSGKWHSSNNQYYLVAHDITQQQEMERHRQKFISLVSHQLKAPLLSVHDFFLETNQGIHTKLNSKGQEQVQVSLRNISRLTNLIDELLDSELLASGHLKIRPVSVSSRKLMQRSIDSVAGLAATLEVEIQPDGPDVSIEADSDRCVQVLVNLIGNALKFSPRHTSVLVQCKLLETEIEFHVIDQGEGIHQTLCASIFERFRQGHTSDIDKEAGTGLGLAICKAIVEAHDGSIGVNSHPGRGSDFWFRLPIIRNNNQESSSL